MRDIDVWLTKSKRIMSRIPWNADFPDVIVHCAYGGGSDDDSPRLKDHALYPSAKGERDVFAALDLIDDIAKEEAFNRIRAIVNSAPKGVNFVAPSAHEGDSNNALAISYAQWLGKQFDMPVEERIFQQKKHSRDKSDSWFRLSHPTEFYGSVDKNVPYVIADDVITLGGTLCDLRSFIHRQGGSVIGMTTLASKDGLDKRIGLSQEVRTVLERTYGNDLSTFCHGLFGYSYECFSNDEGKIVSNCKGFVDLKQRVLRARDPRNAPRRKRGA